MCVLDERGEKVAVTATPPDGDGLRHLLVEALDLPSALFDLCLAAAGEVA